MPIRRFAAPTLAALLLCTAAVHEAKAITIPFGYSGTTAPVTLTLTQGLAPVSFLIELTDISGDYSPPPETGPGIIPPPGTPSWGTAWGEGSYKMTALDWGADSADPQAPGFSYAPASGGLTYFSETSQSFSVPVTVTYDPTQNSCISTTAPCYYINVYNNYYIVFWTWTQDSEFDTQLGWDGIGIYGQAVVPVWINAAPGPAPVPLPASALLLLAGLGALGAASRRGRRKA